ncbi:MAG TPA: hypothetical protein DIT26_01735 [Mesotoga infera]|uniref:Uncharacterized protein n=1 Tax=Mesotoga infera TaxID=1236046 RepID=A0A101I9Z9_9BACT|nr:MAG: Uncharacterized protein XE02_0148 [Mesotoga infera]HCO69300.1 hypothetical protein [Mesotoga infera]
MFAYRDDKVMYNDFMYSESTATRHLMNFNHVCRLFVLLIALLLLTSGCWVIKKPSEVAELAFERSIITVQEGWTSSIRLIARNFSEVYVFEVVLEVSGGVEITNLESNLDGLTLIAGSHIDSKVIIHGAFPYNQQEVTRDFFIEIEIRANESGDLRINSNFALDNDLSVVKIKTLSSTVEVAVR